MEYESVEASELLVGDTVVNALDETATVKSLRADDDGCAITIEFHGSRDDQVVWADDMITILKRS